MMNRGGVAFPQQRTNAGDKLLKYMLFLEEAQLAGGVKGTTDFAKKFSGRGLRDAKGRSLYQLDLRTRLLKYKCSYLIYSDPSTAKAARMGFGFGTTRTGAKAPVLITGKSLF